MESRRPCPICGGSPNGIAYPYQTIWHGKTFDYVSCASCKSIYVDPLPSGDDFQKMYSREAYHESFAADPPVLPDEKLLKTAARHLDANLPVLDFGCGTGFFIEAMRAMGWECDGSELDATARETAASYTGADIYSLEELLERGPRYGTIHLGDVLEHLPDPTGTMKTLERLLLPGGRFFLEGPLEKNLSVAGYAASTFGILKRRLSHPHNTWPPYHLFRVTARGQRDYFEKTLGYATKWFHVFETGWPYSLPGKTVWRPGSATNFLRLSVAGMARGAAAASRPFGLQMGNKFAAVLSPVRMA